MNTKQTLKFLLVSLIASIVGDFGMGWILRTYSDLYATLAGDLITSGITAILFIAGMFAVGGFNKSKQ